MVKNKADAAPKICFSCKGVTKKVVLLNVFVCEWMRLE